MVLGNRIGTNKEGNKVVLAPNLETGFPVGVFINDSPGNEIGGTAPGAGNVISGCGVAVYITGFNASGNAIRQNLIGTVRALPNGQVLNDAVGVGIYINGAGTCTVGGSTAAAENVIQNYSSYGVFIFGTLATGNVVERNQIGVAGGKGQLAGVAIQDASRNTVGGSAKEVGNTITGNVDSGVYIFGHGNSAQDNRIASNNIQKNLYGVLLFNAPDNGSYSSLKSGNRFAKNQIANVREFTGAVNSASGALRKATASQPKRTQHAVRPRPRPSVSLFRAQLIKGDHNPH
jgi:hypothetical protein